MTWDQEGSGGGGAGGVAVADFSVTATEVTTTAASGSVTVLHQRTITGMPAGKYHLHASWYLGTKAPGATEIRASTDGGSTWTRLAGASATHSQGSGDYRHHHTGYTLGATGDVIFQVVHFSEGSSVTYGHAGDPRWGRKLSIIGGPTP